MTESRNIWDGGENADGLGPGESFEPDGSLERQYRTEKPFAARQFSLVAGSVEVDMNDPSIDFEGLPKDVEQLSIEAVETQGSIEYKSWVDVGAGYGALLDYLRLGFGHKGPSYGIEPNLIRKQAISRKLANDVLRDVIMKMPTTEHSDRLIASAFMGGPEWTGRNPDDLDFSKRIEVPSIELIEGSATHIPLPDNAADILSAVRMMYGLEVDEIDSAFEEFKRVMDPEGIFMMITTDRRHRTQERFLLGEVNRYLGVDLGPPLNHRFTTQKADIVVPEKFDYVYKSLHEEEIVIKDWLSMLSLMNSLRSVRDLSKTIVPEEDFEKALALVVFPLVYYRIVINKPFVDQAKYSIYLGSDHPLENLPKNFERVEKSQASS